MFVIFREAYRQLDGSESYTVGLAMSTLNRVVETPFDYSGEIFQCSTQAMVDLAERLHDAGIATVAVRQIYGGPGVRAEDAFDDARLVDIKEFDPWVF